MAIDQAMLGPLAILLGALIGGGTSLLVAVYTQRQQDRLQRIATEVARREAVYADYVMHASNLLLNSYVSDKLVLSGDEQHLVGLLNRMRLFATPAVIEAAETALRAIVAIALQPSMEVRKLATAALAKGLEPDPLLAFSLVCRADLDRVRRGPG